MIFITGGVRSGKSDFAEKLAIACRKENGRLHYLATSIVYDEEMQGRINRHQEMREKREPSFITHEQPMHIEQRLNQFQKNDVVLIDCLTTLLNNELFVNWESGQENWRKKQFRKEIMERLLATFRQFQLLPITTILVSNEISYSLPPEDDGTFIYLQLLGEIHQKIVEQSEKAILVEYGIPIIKKGSVTI